MSITSVAEKMVTADGTESLTPEVNESGDLVILTYQDARRWMLLNNPDIAKNRPQDLDWAAIKAEGRRY